MFSRKGEMPRDFASTKSSSGTALITNDPYSNTQLLHFESDLEAALLNLVLNTGLERVRNTKNLISSWEIAEYDPQPSPQYIVNLSNEVLNNVTESDLGRIFDNFIRDWNIEASLFSCASCEVKAFEMGSRFSTIFNGWVWHRRNYTL